MTLLRSITRKLFHLRSVKRRSDAADIGMIPVAVRPISGLPSTRIRRVRRWRLAAMFAAWRAVNANTPEVDFLRIRHAIDRATAPRDVTAPIPDTEINDTGTFVVAGTDRRHPSETIFDGPTDNATTQGPVAAEAAFQRAAAEAAGASVAGRAAEYEEDAQRVERRLREVGEDLDRLTNERNDATTARTHAVESGRVDLTPPRIPPAGVILFWRCCEIATVVGEWAAFFFAMANMSGVDPTALALEWTQGAGHAILGSAVTALVTAGGAFVLAEWAIDSLKQAIADQGAETRKVRLWAASVALGFVAALLVTMAVSRAQLGTAGHTSIATVALYTVIAAAPLVAGTRIHLLADDLAAKRAAAVTIAETPNRLDVASRMREEYEQALIAERERLRAQRAELTTAIQRLNASVFGGDQAIRDIARHETRVVDEWLDSLRAACAVDQGYFRFYARKLDRESLLAAPPSSPVGALVPIRKRRTA